MRSAACASRIERLTLDWPRDPRPQPVQALRGQAGARARRSRSGPRRLPRRYRPQRFRQDDAASTLRRTGRTDLRGLARGDGPRAYRLPRARPAPLPRAHRAREPRPVRAAVPDPGAPRAERHAARALRALAQPERARRLVLTRHDAAARALPRPPPRSGALAPGRALQRP